MPEPIRLADYRPPAFTVDTVDLRFELEPGATRVTSHLAVRRQAEGELTLNGSELKLIALRVDGRTLEAADYDITGDGEPDLPSEPECDPSLPGEVCFLSGGFLLLGIPPTVT